MRVSIIFINKNTTALSRQQKKNIQKMNEVAVEFIKLNYYDNNM